MNYRYAAIIALALIIAGGFFFMFGGQQKEAKPVISILDFTQKASTGQAVQVTAKAAGETEITKITSKTQTEELQQQCGQKECTALFTHKFTKPGTQQIEVTTHDSKGNTAAQKIIVQIFSNEKTCIDQTPTGTCSKNKPFYCTGQLLQGLVEKCSRCGCPAGTECKNEKCAPIAHTLQIISAQALPAKIIKPQMPFEILVTLKNQENELAAKGAAYTFKAKLIGPNTPQTEKSFALEKDLAQNETTEARIEFNGLNEGVYSLELELKGNDDNFEQFSLPSFVEASTEKTPPSAPTGLKTQLGGNGLELSWNPNTEADLAGYKIFKSNSIEPTHIAYSIFQTVDHKANKITIQGLEDGKYYFVMKAFDYLGNESPYSQYIKVEKG
ncbi:MAG: fibronectin type III domain-containing protein [archaeon]